MVELPKHVFKVKARGRDYYYYHPYRSTSMAGERVRIKGGPHEPEFWQQIRELTGTEEEKPRFGTFSSLINAYKNGPEYALLKPRTKKEYDRHLTTIETAWGSILVKGLKARSIMKLRDLYADTPTKANHVLEVLSAIITWGIPRDYTDANPCRDIPKFKRGAGYAPWSWDAIEHFHNHATPPMWNAAALALYTGQRCGDVLKMKWRDVDRGEIAVTQDKTGKQVWIPVHRDLSNLLADMKRNSIFILTNNKGVPWSGGFQSSWNKQMKKPVMETLRSQRLVFHGLRKSAVVFLLEAGCTDAQVSAITGQTRQMVEHYSLMVNQRRLAKEAILKWEKSER